MGQKYKRVVLYRYGGPKVLNIIDDTMLEPQKGQVRVKILYSGVCFADVMVREGVHPVKPPLPTYPGSEVAGVVDALGEGVTAFRIGQPVAALTPVGGKANAEYVCIGQSHLLGVAPNVDLKRVIPLTLNYLTAYQMLTRIAHVNPGEKILVCGAAGGVGSAFLDLGRLMNLRVYGLVSPSKHDYVRKLGGIPIDYRRKDLVNHVLELSEGGVHAAFDPIGGRHWLTSFRMLNLDGRLVGFGFSATFKHGRFNVPSGLLSILTMPRFSLLKLLANSANRAVMGYVTESYRHEDWYREDLAALLAMLERRQIDPVIHSILPLDKIADAHRLMNESAVTGKLVLSCAKQ